EAERGWKMPSAYWTLLKERVLSVLPLLAEAEGRRIEKEGLQPLAWEAQLAGTYHLEAGVAMHLKARADRVDRDGEGAVFVTDYKWSALGNYTAADYRSFQLPVYVWLAAQREKAAPGYGWYVSLSRPGTVVPKTRKIGVQDWFETARGWFMLYVPAMRKGLFPPLPGGSKDEEPVSPRRTDQECKYCPFSNLCRIRGLEGRVLHNPLLTTHTKREP
ncbi:MAG: PD-(D/E)XK nuclease family protein, partial [bacterium]